jgi:NitT/TauT family transport system substrate-binding protein
MARMSLSVMRFKRIFGLFMVVAAILSAGQSMAEDKLPVLNVGYIFTTHHSPFIAAMAQERGIQGFWRPSASGGGQAQV